MNLNYKAYMNASFEDKPSGSWIAFVKGKEVANGMNLQEVLLKVRQDYPGETPLLVQVLPEEDLILMGLTMAKHRIIIEKAPYNYSAYSPDLPGCVATGKDLDEVRKNMKEAIELHIEGFALGETGMGDYLADLEDYEERLARGKIHW